MHEDWQVGIVRVTIERADLRSELHKAKPASACNPLDGICQYSSQVNIMTC
jgi:hypothetical protein